MHRRVENESESIAEAALDQMLRTAFEVRGERTRGSATRPPRPRSEVVGDSLGEAGRYELVEEIGRGGSGVVFRGRDGHLGRDLALKVLSDTGSSSQRDRRRFLDEARICGQLEHPGIVPLYDLGAGADGAPYFAMRLVEGGTLSERLRDRESPLEDRPRLLSIVLQVAQAMSYAHARGVVHRDLKPSNIMVGSHGEVQILDWGLARPVGSAAEPGDGVDPVQIEDRERTIVGVVSGTPAYMAPEQARGESHALDPRWDVFALGAILCELLTGSPPFTGAGSHERRRRAAEADLGPALERLARCEADDELIELTRRCLAPVDRDRPADAGAVARALEQYLNGVERRAEEARAAAAAAEVRAAAEARTRRVTVALLAVVLLAVTVGAVTWWLVTSARGERLAATRAEVGLALDDALTRGSRADVASLDSALDAVARAEAALAAGSSDGALSARVLQVRRELESRAEHARAASVQAARDDELRRALRAAQDRAAARLGVRTLQRAYTAAFADWGVDVANVDEAAARIRGSAVLDDALVALHHWGLFKWSIDDADAVARGDEAARSRALALQLADAIDDDERRRGLRRAIREREAVALLALANEDTPGPRSWVEAWVLGEALVGLGEDEAALRTWKRGARAYPGSYWLHRALGALAVTREVPGAAAHLGAAVTLRPDSADAWNLLGIHHDANGHVEDARRAFEEAARLTTERNAIRNLWFFLDRRGEYDAALEAAHVWAAAHPEDPLAAYSRAETLGRVGRQEDRRRDLEKAIELAVAVLANRADDADTWLVRGRAERALGLLEEARSSLEAVVDLRPDDYDGNHELGHVLFDLKRWKEAETVFARALVGAPDDPELLTDVAFSRYWDRRPREALPLLRRAHELGGPRATSESIQVVEGRARMHDLVDGLVEPRDVDEMMNVGITLADDYEDYVNAARFYGLAFEADLHRSFGAQFFAGCCAVRAAAGEGVGASELSDEDRRRLRDEGYSWLRRHLDIVSREAPLGRVPQGWIDEFDEWRPAPELASVRGADALKALEAEERQRWSQLWTDLDAFLKSQGR